MQAERSSRPSGWCFAGTRQLSVLALLATLIFPVAGSAQPRRAPSGTSSQTPSQHGAVAQRGKNKKVAVVAFEAPDGWRTPVHQGLKQGLAKAGFAGVGFPKVQKAMNAQPENLNCMDKKCLAALRKVLKAKRFIKAVVTKGSGLDLTVELQLWSPKKQLKSATRDCQPCSLGQLKDKVIEAVVEVMAKPTAMPVRIVSNPTGATVTLVRPGGKGTDGGLQELGATPYEGKLLPGRHVLQVNKAEHIPQRIDIEVKEKSRVGDEVQIFQVSLVPLTIQDIDELAPPVRPFAGLKWLGLGGTISAIGVGVLWLALDGREQGCDFAVCPRVYDTRLQSYGAFGFGALTGALTYFMFRSDNRTVSDYERRKNAQDRAALVPTLVPVPGGAFAQFRLAF